MPTSNEQIFDELVRQQINLQRMSRGEGERLLSLLRESDKELEGFIRSATAPWTKARLAEVRKEIQRVRMSAISGFSDQLTGTMTGTGAIESSVTQTILSKSVPVEINFAAPPPAAVRNAIMGTPFGSFDKMMTLSEWVANLGQADQARLMGAVRAGVLNGETIPQITNRMQQAMDITRQQAEALARTGINHASNVARTAVFEENADVILALRWVSTLDGRTSPVCRSNDGKFRPVDGSTWESVPEPHLPAPGMSPPAHMRCRSLLIAILDNESIADQLANIERPTVRDTRTGKQRQLDFEKQARARYNARRGPDDPAWDDLPGDQKAPFRSEVRKEWAQANVGSVPAETTYDEWLRRQPAEFQDQILGKTRGEMYRANQDMTMDHFVDGQGNYLSLEELDDISVGPKVLPEPEPAPVVETPEERRMRGIRERGDATEMFNANYQNAEQIMDELHDEAMAKFPNDNMAAAKYIRKHKYERLGRLVPPSEDPAAYRAWLDSLSPTERQAFITWGREDFPKLMRDIQRGRKLTPGQEGLIRHFKEQTGIDVREQMEALQSALDRAPAFEGAVFRGAVVRDPSQLVPGAVIGEGAFASASYHGRIAVDFATARARSFGGKAVVFKIEGLSAQRRGAVAVQNLTGDLELSKEAEVLLMPDLRYEVVETNDFGQFLEVVVRAL